MPSFRVWDPTNEERPEDYTHDAYDAQAAAERYAEEDGDGNADNIYGRSGGHEIHVEDGAGALQVFRVALEYEPTYYARPAGT